MKFSITTKNRESVDVVLRGLGYRYLFGNEKAEMSFVKPLGENFYPRWHLYVKQYDRSNNETRYDFSLHLDQKKPAYKGVTRHSGDYDSDIVNKEAERIKRYFQAPL